MLYLYIGYTRAYSCHVTRDLDECEGRYRKRRSLRGMKQERIFCLKTEIFVINVVFLDTVQDQDAPVSVMV